VIASIVLCLTGVIAPADDPPPRGEPPRLWRARAEKNGEQVVVTIAKPAERATADGGPRADGVVIQPSGTMMVWDDFPAVNLGPDAKAFTAAGKPLDTDAVTKVLAKPRPVAVFLRDDKELVAPEQFYLKLLRDDAVVLVVRKVNVYPIVP
jgi:hypothetical protein